MFEQADSDDTDLFRSEKPLTTSHTPETVVGRTDEIEAIADAIRPLAHRRTPENLLVVGPAGVGKTTCVEHVLDRLEAETRVKPVRINCWQYDTRPSLLTELLIQLGYPAPRKGKPVDELLAKLQEWLDKNRSIVVVLDEFDRLEDATDVVYDLHQLNTDADHHIGVVMISNTVPGQFHLDPRSRSRLSYHVVDFEPYAKPELAEILEQRVQQAFEPDTVPDEVLDALAEWTAENGGDCRQAIEALRQAGRQAERRGTNAVTTETVEEIVGDAR